MRKSLAIILSFSLPGLNGCTSVDIKGRSFYETKADQNSQSGETEYRTLEKFLYEATEGSRKNQVSADELRKSIPGNPKVIITKSSETWVYEYTRTEESLKMGWNGLRGKNSLKTERLELNFNKNLILTDYKINPDPFISENSEQKIKWGFLILKWLLVGATAGAAAGAAFNKQKK